MRRRLFEGLEKRVAASRQHLFSIVDDEKFDGSFKGRKACFLDELPHSGDGMLVAFRIWKDQMDVGMFFFGSAHEKLCDLVGKMAFSNAVWSVQKEHMRKCLFIEKPA